MPTALTSMIFLAFAPSLLTVGTSDKLARLETHESPTHTAESFNARNVKLLSQIGLHEFGSKSGNDCWGYVSPSGREYALVGLDNKVAFVEVTDPKNPVYFDHIPHKASLWGDLKTYGEYCYVVTEASDSGIQVIDLSRIDEHVVTLVQTINSPGRSHNVCIDTTSGFLYTLGSRGGTGTTMCFSLADPANPVKVGADSMTGKHYQHDVTVVTFEEGPYAGRQVMFGNGEGRGVEIWDVTNKEEPFIIGQASYVDIGYNHQGWLSEDKKYWFVNDELDETKRGTMTNTRVFDVSDLSNPTLVGSFGTGLPTIDHNLYLKSGFMFASNYTSGLRVFDTNDSVVAPKQTGFIDTYPERRLSRFCRRVEQLPVSA